MLTKNVSLLFSLILIFGCHKSNVELEKHSYFDGVIMHNILFNSDTTFFHYTILNADSDTLYDLTKFGSMTLKKNYRNGYVYQQGEFSYKWNPKQMQFPSYADSGYYLNFPIYSDSGLWRSFDSLGNLLGIYEKMNGKLNGFEIYIDSKKVSKVKYYKNDKESDTIYIVVPKQINK